MGRTLDKIQQLLDAIANRGCFRRLSTLTLDPWEFVAAIDEMNGILDADCVEDPDRKKNRKGPFKVCGVKLCCHQEAASLDQMIEACKKGEWPQRPHTTCDIKFEAMF